MAVKVYSTTIPLGIQTGLYETVYKCINPNIDNHAHTHTWIRRTTDYSRKMDCFELIWRVQIENDFDEKCSYESHIIFVENPPGENRPSNQTLPYFIQFAVEQYSTITIDVTAKAPRIVNCVLFMADSRYHKDICCCAYLK